MPSTRTVYCRTELREKVEATEVSAHGQIVCCNQLRENIGAILYRSKSQSTRTDFQSVATFMIVLIMKFMSQTDRLKLCVIYKYGNIIYKA